MVLPASSRYLQEKKASWIKIESCTINAYQCFEKTRAQLSVVHSCVVIIWWTCAPVTHRLYVLIQMICSTLRH